MKKYRVVLRAHTSRRDVAPAALLARTLERFGCETYIASVRNFYWILKTWNPDAVVSFAPGKGPEIRKLAPKALSVFFDGEGHQTIDSHHPGRWSQSPEQYETLDRIYAWGDVLRQQMATFAPELDASKIKVVGNPKMDLIRYLPERIANPDAPPSVGIVGRFGTINNYEGVSPLRSLWKQFDVDTVVSSVKAYYYMHHSIVAILNNTDYNVSIRPHPIENIYTYHDHLMKQFPAEHWHRVEIDDSVMIPEWIARQSVLIAPTTTSFLEAYLLGKPMINVDLMSDTVEFNRNLDALCAEWQDGSIMPETIDDLITILKNPLPRVERDEAIENQLHTHCNWQSNTSACLAVARDLIEILERTRHPSLALPRAAIDLRDRISFARAVRRDRLHTNFNYREGYHQLPEYLDEMVDIMLEREAQGEQTKEAPALRAAAAG